MSGPDSRCPAGLAVEAVLFDLDGTLADSGQVTAAALGAVWAQAKAGGEPPLEEFLALSGLPLEDILGRLGISPRLAAVFRAEAIGRAGQVRLFRGALDLLRQLRDSGVKIGIITGKDLDRAVQVLEHLGIAGLVDELVTPDHDPEPKPSPQGVWWLCQRLGAQASRTLLVGDSAADLCAGRDAGVRTVACLWGAGRPEDLTPCSPWRMAGSIDELARLLKAVIMRP